MHIPCIVVYLLHTDVKMDRQNNTQKSINHRRSTKSELTSDNGNQSSRSSTFQIPVVGTVQTVRSMSGSGSIVLCSSSCCIRSVSIKS